MNNLLENLKGEKKEFSTETLNTLISFHIGKGGRFYNSGYKKFIDTDKSINDYTSDLFISFENYKIVAKEIGDRPNLMELLEIAYEKEDTKSIAYLKLNKLGLDLGQLMYYDAGGCEVGLYVINDDTGCIDIDGDYNTTIVCRLKDCTQDELQLIINHCGENKYNENAQYYGYASKDVIDYAAFMLGLIESN